MNVLLRSGANPIPTQPVQNPPVPPQAVALAADPVPLEVRRMRVANGSRRQRDLAAVRMAEELETLERIGQVDAAVVADVWPAVLTRLRASVPETTYRIWIEPLAVAGEDRTTLILTAPTGICGWIERRYSRLIVEALAEEGTDFEKVAFVPAGSGK